MFLAMFVGFSYLGIESGASAILRAQGRLTAILLLVAMSTVLIAAEIVLSFALVASTRVSAGGFIFFAILGIGGIAGLAGMCFKGQYRKTDKPIYGLFAAAFFVAAASFPLTWPVVAWKRYEYHNALSLVPAGLHVTSIRFKATEFMGFGPGGSEAGLLLFNLPDVVARDIARDGITYFNAMERSPESRAAHKDYWEWQQTPAVHPGFPVGSELCVYDACSDIPFDVQKQVNAITASTDNYFAFGRNAIVVVSPGEKTVIVHYRK
jgi:hypothetical protein